MPAQAAPNSDALVTWTQAIYALHALSLAIGILGAASIVGAFLIGWPSIVAVILNYVKRSEARGTWLESHFRWQIRTFWFGALWVGLCALFVIFTLGLGLLAGVDAARHRGALVHLSRRARLDGVERPPSDVRVSQVTRRWGPALYALLCLIWGSTWLVIKVGYGGLGPFNVAGLRFLRRGHADGRRGTGDAGALAARSRRVAGDDARRRADVRRRLRPHLLGRAVHRERPHGGALCDVAADDALRRAGLSARRAGHGGQAGEQCARTRRHGSALRRSASPRRAALRRSDARRAGRRAVCGRGQRREQARRARHPAGDA